MKTLLYQLLVLCFIMGGAGAIMAQNEGKHLGSTQDAQHYGEPMHKRSASQPGHVPKANDAGGKYERYPYSSETGMYLNDGWAQGYAVLSDHSRMDHLLLRYDVYNQQMQFVSGNDTLAFSDPEELEYLQLDGKRFVYEEFEHDGVLERGYFEVLKEGDCKLLLRRTVTHHICNDVITGSGGDEYLRDVAYFVKKNEEVAREIRTCKKSVLCAFDDEKEKVKEFMKTNDLKMKCCEDLMQVVAFYNSLH